MYIVTYKGKFGFIKPWTAVRDGETYSQQFLTPSIIEGIEKKLFPEMLEHNGVISKIQRHKLSYKAIDSQQEVTQTRGWKVSRNQMTRERSILKRGVMLDPVLYIAFKEIPCSFLVCVGIRITDVQQHVLMHPLADVGGYEGGKAVGGGVEGLVQG